MRTCVLLIAAFAVAAFSAVVQQPLHKRSSLGTRLKRPMHTGLKTGRGPQRMQASVANAPSQPIIDYYDDFYLANITLGTPAQTLTVMLDTGTSDLWVIDAACQTEACTYRLDAYTRHQFDPIESSSFTNTSKRFTLYFGSEGTSTGYIGADVVTLGGGLSYDSQDVLVTTDLAHSYGDYPLDGVLGLAWPAFAYSGVTPVMQNLLPQLDEPLFTVWLDRHVKMSEGLPGGLISYGALDLLNCDAQVNYVTLSSKTYWQFALNNFQVAGYSTGKTQQAISDTGGSWIAGPGSAFNAIIITTGAAYDWLTGYYTLPCSGTYTDLIFTIGAFQYRVPSTEYVIDLDLADGKCALAVTSLSSAGGFAPDWLLGDTFIRTYCNVYDIGNARIGFAKAHHTQI